MAKGVVKFLTPMPLISTCSAPYVLTLSILLSRPSMFPIRSILQQPPGSATWKMYARQFVPNGSRELHFNVEALASVRALTR